MRCSKCGADNREGRKFCTQCGSALATKCLRCGAALGTPPAAIGKSHEPHMQIADTPHPEMEQAGPAFEIARSRFFLGWAIARLGNPDEGIAMIRSGLAQA